MEDSLAWQKKELSSIREQIPLKRSMVNASRPSLLID